MSFPFSLEWDKLNTYLREHINLEYGFTLINKCLQLVIILNQMNLIFLNKMLIKVDLRIHLIVKCYMVLILKIVITRIYYDDNRRAGRSWDIPLQIINLFFS